MGMCEPILCSDTRKIGVHVLRHEFIEIGSQYLLSCRGDSVTEELGDL